MLVFIGWHRPLQSNFANNMEILNEMTILFALYLVMCYTDFVGEPETRNICGWAFIGVISIFLSIHIIFLFGGACKSVYQGLRSCYYKKRRSEALKAIQTRLEASKGSLNDAVEAKTRTQLAQQASSKVYYLKAG